MTDLKRTIRDITDIAGQREKLPCSFGGGDCIVVDWASGISFCLRARQIGKYGALSSIPDRESNLYNAGCPNPRKKLLGLGPWACKYADGKSHIL